MAIFSILPHHPPTQPPTHSWKSSEPVYLSALTQTSKPQPQPNLNPNLNLKSNLNLKPNLNLN